MAKTIAIANHKGGVGKTTTTASMGAVLASKGYRTLLVDLDAQANLTYSLLQYEPEITIYNSLSDGEALPIKQLRENLWIIPSSLDMAGLDVEIVGAISREYILRNLLEPLAAEYDYILLDCPPSLGLLTINALVAANEVLIPLAAEPLPYRGLSKMQELMDKTRKNLNPSLRLNGIVITRWERSNVTSMIEQALRESVGKVVYASRIRKNIAIAEASLSGTDINTYSSTSNGAEDYRNLTTEFLLRTRGAQSNTIIQ